VIRPASRRRTSTVSRAPRGAAPQPAEITIGEAISSPDEY